MATGAKKFQNLKDSEICRNEVSAKIQMVYITCKDEKEALRIADVLVRERLVACANIVNGIKSVYWWKVKVEKKRECLLLCKTTGEKAKDAMQRAKELHSYKVPCIVGYESIAADSDYENWVAKEVRK